MNATKGIVVPAGGGKHLDMKAPGRFAALKLLGHETNGSIMLFEETVPPGTKASSIHREATRSPGCSPARSPSRSATMSAWAARHARVLPAQRPACLEEHRQRNRPRGVPRAGWRGGYVEELMHRPDPMNDAERMELRERYRWEIVGPNPL
jgi:hypothetical protein